ncbi:MAG TPA: GyrI-like domain-containing protein [Terracidiphilus sp.]|nr:GyrI-like domain-containing protein [Terracidiphilus sp.]
MPSALRAILLLSLILLTPASNSTQESRAMPHSEDSFYVAGFSARTNNAKEATGHGVIGQLWQDFYQKDLAAQIPHRIGADTIVVYSDYDSDEKGDYTYLLGTRVSSVDNLPSGMTYRKIAPGTYAVLTTDRGPVTEVVSALWKKIWGMTPEDLGGKRAFLTDYEVYDQRAADPHSAQVEFHIGVQPQ